MGTWSDNNDGKPNFPWLEKENPHAPGTTYGDALELITDEEIAKIDTDADELNLRERGITGTGWWLVLRTEDFKGNVSYESECLANFRVDATTANKQETSSDVAYELNFLGYRWNDDTSSGSTPSMTVMGALAEADVTNGWMDADIEDNAFVIDNTKNGTIIPRIDANPDVLATALTFTLQVRENNRGNWKDNSSLTGGDAIGSLTNQTPYELEIATAYDSDNNRYRWKVEVTAETAVDGDKPSTIYTAPFKVSVDS